MAITTDEIEAEIRKTFPKLEARWVAPSDLGLGAQLQSGGSVGVRPSHALSAVRSPDAVERFDIGDGLTVGLILKWVEQAGYHIVLEVVEQPNKTYIAHGWRIYDAPQDISPTTAFASLIESFGIVIEGTENQLFVARRPSSPTGEVRGSAGEGQNFAVNAFMKKTATGVETSFIFGFDTGRYEEYVRRHQR